MLTATGGRAGTGRCPGPGHARRRVRDVLAAGGRAGGAAAGRPGGAGRGDAAAHRDRLARPAAARRRPCCTPPPVRCTWTGWPPRWPPRGWTRGSRPWPGWARWWPLAGVAFKMSAVPFHLWTPDTYAGAPLPVAAFLAVVSKSAGVAAILILLGVGAAVAGRRVGTGDRGAGRGDDDGGEPRRDAAAGRRPAARLVDHGPGRLGAGPAGGGPHRHPGECAGRRRRERRVPDRLRRGQPGRLHRGRAARPPPPGRRGAHPGRLPRPGPARAGRARSC